MQIALEALHAVSFVVPDLSARAPSSVPVHHSTEGSVNVFNLVDGEEAVVESPSGAFKPFVVHYAETFIIPASVGEYTIAPYGRSEGREFMTIKAYVRF